MWSNRWKKGVDYPEWADADVYKKNNNWWLSI